METIIVAYLYASYLFMIGYLMNKNISTLHYFIFIWIFSPIALPAILGYELGKLNKVK
jgi:hypothetical protein